ncbi:MAG TPA: twin-arginine translocation signal domain-containing protein, partial [Rhizomicrobium sp.]
MSKNDHEGTIGRRRFLKGATLAGAALGAPATAAAQPSVASAASRPVPKPDMAAETLPPPPDPIQQT